MQKFIDLFSEHAGTAMIRQKAFADYISNRPWSLVLSEEQVNFGDDLNFPIQLIGSESERDNSWMWAWANKESNLPENLLKASYLIQSYGQKNGIDELTDPTYKLTKFDGFVLGLLASSLAGNKCIYRGPYDGGALFFTVENTPENLNEPASCETILSTLSQMLSEFELNHKIFIESFLTQQGLQVEQTQNHIKGTRDTHKIDITFDDLNRVVNIQGNMNVEQSKPWWKIW